MCAWNTAPATTPTRLKAAEASPASPNDVSASEHEERAAAGGGLRSRTQAQRGARECRREHPRTEASRPVVTFNRQRPERAIRRSSPPPAAARGASNNSLDGRRNHHAPSHRSFKDERAIRASTIDTIQKRTTIFCSSQPAFSKW